MEEKQLEQILGFSIEEAIQNFKRIYPELSVAIVGANNKHNGLIIKTMEGDYYTINETCISTSFADLNQAKDYGCLF